jgi:hypothetical protein
VEARRVALFSLISVGYSIMPSASRLHGIKSRRMRWAGHVPRTGRREMHIGFLVVKPQEREDYDDKDVGGWKIL